MNIRLVLNTLGKLFLLIAGCMAIPLIMAIYQNSKDLIPFIISILAAIAIGLCLKYLIPSKDNQFSFREAPPLQVS